MWANQTDQSKTAVPARAAKLYDTTIGRAGANAMLFLSFRLFREYFGRGDNHALSLAFD
jgi:hypothetical protein